MTTTSQPSLQRKEQSPPNSPHSLVNFSTDFFSLSDATPTLSQPLLPNIRGPPTPTPAPPPPSTSESITPTCPPNHHPSPFSPLLETAGIASFGGSHHSSPTPTNTLTGAGGGGDTLSPSRAAYMSSGGGVRGSSPFSGDTTPSFEPEDIDIGPWPDEEDGGGGHGGGGGTVLFPELGLGMGGGMGMGSGSGSGNGDIGITGGQEQQQGRRSEQQQHHNNTWPTGSSNPHSTTTKPTLNTSSNNKRSRGTLSTHYDDGNDDLIITGIRRAETDSSLTSFKIVSPVVRVEEFSPDGGGVNGTVLVDSVVSVTSSSASSSHSLTSAALPRPISPQPHQQPSPTTQHLSSPLSPPRDRRGRSLSDVGTRPTPPQLHIPIERNEEGVWGGLSPELRKGLVSAGPTLGIGGGGASGYLPMNLKEQEQWRKIMEKNEEVREWLSKSPISQSRIARALSGKKGSKNGESNGNDCLSVPKARDRRSKSISDFRGVGEAVREFLGVHKSTPAPAVPAAAAGTETRLEIENMGGIRGLDPSDMDDTEEETQSFVDSSWEEGSLDNWGSSVGVGQVPVEDDSLSPPVHPDDIMNLDNPDDDEILDEDDPRNFRRESHLSGTLTLDNQDEEYDPAKDPDKLPNLRQFYNRNTWKDSTDSIHPNRPIPRRALGPHQNSNAAITMFQRAVDNMETASRVATFGSSRDSRIVTTGEAEMFINSDGILKGLSFKKAGAGGSGREGGRERKSSIFEFTKGLKRSLSTTSGNDSSKSPLSERDGDNHAGRDGVGDGRRSHSRNNSLISPSVTFPPPRWMQSWTSSHGRKGKLSIDTAIGAMTGHLAAVGAGEGTATSPINLAAPAQGVKRSRSKSDLSTGAKLIKPRPASKELDLQTLMKRHGGPPAVPITSPSSITRRHTFGSTTSPKERPAGVGAGAGMYDSDEDGDGEDEVISTKPVRKMDFKPSLQAYMDHVRELNPMLDEALVRRIGQEQMKRYNKLMDHKTKHAALIKAGKCPNKQKCQSVAHTTLASPSSPIHSSTNNDPNPNNSSGDFGAPITSAQFPANVPVPPASRLPATFECPICHKLKTFQKPSDWTKHVHEDVQPFTCTFPDCNEPKSFKRKADWVRHENERHRHLEWWKCNQTDCTHVCYRKDNFVQHLVREHKMPEPKVKAMKAAAAAAAAATKSSKGRGKKAASEAVNHPVPVDPQQEAIDRVWQIVDACHNDTQKEPGEEKCRFCGVTCSTWKKLTVHLARHMEQISLPILEQVKGEGKGTEAGAEKSSIGNAFGAGLVTPTSATTLTPNIPINGGGVGGIGNSPLSARQQQQQVTPKVMIDSARLQDGQFMSNHKTTATQSLHASPLLMAHLTGSSSNLMNNHSLMDITMSGTSDGNNGHRQRPKSSHGEFSIINTTSTSPQNQTVGNVTIGGADFYSHHNSSSGGGMLGVQSSPPQGLEIMPVGAMGLGGMGLGMGVGVGYGVGMMGNIGSGGYSQTSHQQHHNQQQQFNTYLDQQQQQQKQPQQQQFYPSPPTPASYHPHHHQHQQHQQHHTPSPTLLGVPLMDPSRFQHQQHTPSPGPPLSSSPSPLLRPGSSSGVAAGGGGHDISMVSMEQLGFETAAGMMFDNGGVGVGVEVGAIDGGMEQWTTGWTATG